MSSIVRFLCEELLAGLRAVHTDWGAKRCDYARIGE